MPYLPFVCSVLIQSSVNDRWPFLSLSLCYSSFSLGLSRSLYLSFWSFSLNPLWWSNSLEVLKLFWPRDVWIELILLKLKTENWKHCSKIIFKCVNSAVGPIFNEKIDKKNEICGSVNSAQMHCSRTTGQKLWLLFIYRTWIVPPVGGKGVGKKEKEGKTQKLKTQQTWIQTMPKWRSLWRKIEIREK